MRTRARTGSAPAVGLQHFVGLGLITLFVAGCAGQSEAQQKHLTELSREVIRLTADNASLSHRLDTLETKLERAGTQAKRSGAATPAAAGGDEDRPSLSVVRLTPGGATDLEAPAQRASEEESSRARPLLKSTPQGEIVEQVAEEGEAPASRPSDDFTSAMKLVNTQRCGAAIEALSSFLFRHPDDDRVTEATYWRGRCLQSLGRHRQAVEQFDAVASTKDERVADALFGLYVSHANLGDGKRATIAKDRLIQDFPQAEAAKRVR
jgi:TolA-binding protein